MIRDGGSLSAKFGSDNASQYILFLKIRLDPGPLKWERLGYDEPVLIDCNPEKRPPDTDRVLHSELGGPQIRVSWSEARDVVAAIARLAHGLRAWQENWLQQLLYITAHDGQLPPH